MGPTDGRPSRGVARPGPVAGGHDQPDFAVRGLPVVRPELLVAEGRLLDAVSGGTTPPGATTELTGRLGVPAADLYAAIGELVGVGWLALDVDPDGRLTVRWAEDGR
jgi:hypothetical protein